ncbi:Zeaxanthin epoxidase, chloroplastic [Ancistrocladus abbreviatus]
MAAISTEGEQEKPSPATQRLLGKVAMVTGGAMGIGESIVRLLHKHGAKVCIADIEDEAGQRVCQSVCDDSNVCFVHCDVTVEDDVSHAINFTVERFGTLDIMVNNAGLPGRPYSDIRDADLLDFDKVFNVNAKGVFLGMKHAARVMIPLKKGTIISICSVTGTIGGICSHAYTGSKHAVLGFTRNVAAELGKHGIRVNCVSPYSIPTRLSMDNLSEDERTEDVLAGFRAFAARNANLHGVDLAAEDVAYSVLFLASDESRYVSGLNLMVDGGFTCVNHNLRLFR